MYELDLECHRRVNWLDLNPLKRKANTTGVSVDVIGRAVVTAALRDSGIVCGNIATDQSPPPNSILLISLTSSFDVAACIQSDLPRLKASRTDLTVIVGGPGMQNPFAVAQFADYAFLGRAEDHIAGIVCAILDGRRATHPSLVDTSIMNSASYAQVNDLWPKPVRLASVSRYWNESFVGCPHLCAYCHYSYARRFKSLGRKYFQTSLTPANPEMRLEDIARSPARRIRTSIDGCSERIRYAFGKRISADAIADAMRAMNDRRGTMLHVYNIGNAPSETDDDRAQLDETLRRAASLCKQSAKRLNVLIQTTPFRPSPLTPLAIAPASLWPNWHDRAAETVADTPSVLIKHSFGNESPKSHLTSLAVERHDGSTQAQRTLDIVSSRAFQSASVMDALKMISESEVERLCRAYEWSELPTARWTSWVDMRTIERRSRRIKEALKW